VCGHTHDAHVYSGGNGRTCSDCTMKRTCFTN
jgi:uncharacterized protein (UPF0179 family)